MSMHEATIRPALNSITVDAANRSRPVQVVYLAGDGRSGTTLLSRVLGSYHGCVAVGELYDIWTKSLDGDGICSCGAPLRDCEFWNAVMDDVLGGADDRTLDRIISLRASVQGMRHVPLLLFPWLRTSAFNQRLSEYVELVSRVYVAIRAVSGCNVVVDSSKFATYALALNESPVLDVRVVHLTRDSRACVYSWRRLKRERVAGDRPAYLPQRAIVQSALVWSLRNGLLVWAARKVPFAARLKYEDVARQPRQVLASLVTELGINECSADWTADDELVLAGANHIFAGNPDRVGHGRLRIRADDEWRKRMPRSQKVIATALTLPVLWKLGYSSGTQAHRGSPAPNPVAGKSRL